MSDAHLLSETGTLLEYHPDKNEAIVQVDNSDKRFLYDKNYFNFHRSYKSI